MSAEVTTVQRITHLVCLRTSYNQHDVENRYCGHCHTFAQPGEVLIETKRLTEWEKVPSTQ